MAESSKFFFYIRLFFLYIRLFFFVECFRCIVRKQTKTNRKKVSLSDTDIQGIPKRLEIHCPKVPQFVAMAVTKLGWTEEYAIEKIIPVLTRWQIACPHDSAPPLLEVVKVVKKRVVAGVPSLALEWRPLSEDLVRLLPPSIESTEPHVLVQRHAPKMTADFEESKKKKTTTRKRTAAAAKSKKPETEVGNHRPKPITQFFERVKAAADEGGAPQGTPISSSDLYRRIFLDDSPLGHQQSTPVYPAKVRPSLQDSLDHSDFVGDLSAVIDDIIKENDKEQT